jgi:hypothetical protein
MNSVIFFVGGGSTGIPPAGYDLVNGSKACSDSNYNP